MTELFEVQLEPDLQLMLFGACIALNFFVVHFSCIRTLFVFHIRESLASWPELNSGGGSLKVIILYGSHKTYVLKFSSACFLSWAPYFSLWNHRLNMACLCQSLTLAQTYLVSFWIWLNICLMQNWLFSKYLPLIYCLGPLMFRWPACSSPGRRGSQWTDQDGSAWQVLHALRTVDKNSAACNRILLQLEMSFSIHLR